MSLDVSCMSLLLLYTVRAFTSVNKWHKLVKNAVCIVWAIKMVKIKAFLFLSYLSFGKS